MDTKTKQATIYPDRQLFDNRIDPEWLTIDEASAYLNTKVSHLRDLVYKKEIPHSKLGRLLRFHRPTLRAWMLSNME